MLLVIVILNTASCARDTQSPEASEAPFMALRDIPDITDAEIEAIAKLQAAGSPLIYAATHSTELFEKTDGTLGGYTVLFCDWLSELIGIPILVETHSITELDAGLESGIFDLAAVMATPDRAEIFSLSGPIIQRIFVNYRYEGSPTLSEISRERLPRYAFTENSAVIPIVADALEPGTYLEVIVADEDALYEALKNGDADVFVLTESLSASFDQYDGIYIEDFLPLTILHVSVAAANPDYDAVISVITKAVQNGAAGYLADLHMQGNLDYRRHKFSSMLTGEELEYLQNNPVIPFATQYASYPTSFYDSHEDIWNGMVFDILSEIQEFIGSDFEMVHDEHLELPGLMELLENETAYFMPNLIQTPERAGRFDWLRTYYFTDRYALLSKQSFPNVELNDIPTKRVGLINGTAFAEAFKAWFPNALYVTEYPTADGAYMALDRGEVDLVMSIQSRLTTLTNYYELSDYKANYLFDDGLHVTFAVNKNQTVLRSILDKALGLIDTDRITEQWVSRTYNIETMRLQAQRPWLVGAIALSSVMLALVLIWFYTRSKALVQRAVMSKTRAAAKKMQELEEEKHTLEEDRRHLSEILDTLPVGIRILSLDDWTLLYSNKACLDVFGCSSFEEQVKGRDGLGFMPEIQPDGVPTAEHLAEIANTDRFAAELQCFKLDGQPFICRITSITINYAGHRASLAAMEDITADMEHQERLRNAVIKEQEANQLKSQFLAHMSHEIRTPMNAILGITEIELHSESLSKETKESLGMIYESGNLLMGIINDILDLSKIESGKLEIMPAKYDIPSLINDTVQINRIRYESKPIEFSLDIDENTPLSLQGDALRLKQILNNILANAYKYTEKGNIKLSVSSKASSKDGEITLILQISDTGQGMTQDQLDKLYLEYTRFNLEVNIATEGSGLGMTITKRLLDLMGGEILVESEPGKGSTFTVYIPQKRVNELVCGAHLAEVIRNFRFQSAAVEQRRQTLREYMPYGSVLIVDDVKSNLYVAKGMLLPYGLKVDSANSGASAIEKVKDGNEYDIIFMDHMMPGMDGIEATKLLREMGYTRSIIALTANALVGHAETFLKNGFDSYIPKPIDSRELDNILISFIRDKKPPEVVEAAWQQRWVQQEDQKDEEPAASDYLQAAGMDLSEIETDFLQDAENFMNILDKFRAKNGGFDDGDFGEADLRDYEIAVHGMKSALAIINEAELSGFAYKLEQAATANNLDLIRSETSAFIDALCALCDKIRARG